MLGLLKPRFRKVEGDLEKGKHMANMVEEFNRLQFEQAVETYRTQLSLLVQIATVLIIADATVVGYALSMQIASILLLGSMFPVAILFMMQVVYRLTLPIFYSAVSLESEYVHREADSLASTFVAFINSPEYLAKLRAISSIQNPEERIEQLKKIPLPRLGSGRGIGRISLALIVVAHIVGPVILTVFFNWRFF